MIVAFVDPRCPYCVDTIAILQRLKAERRIMYGLVDATKRPGLRDRLFKKTGSDTLPSIWIDGVYIGGLNSGPAEFGGLKIGMQRNSLESVRSHPDFGKPVPA
jgi:glutaredoxin